MGALMGSHSHLGVKNMAEFYLKEGKEFVRVKLDEFNTFDGLVEEDHKKRFRKSYDLFKESLKPSKKKKEDKKESPKPKKAKKKKEDKQWQT